MVNLLVFEQRLKLQDVLDASKSQDERNRLGQFATPPHLAKEIMAMSKEYLDFNEPVRFLDPAFGTGAFYAALRQIFDMSLVSQAQGIEIDPHYAGPTQDLWKSTKLNLVVADFTQLDVQKNDLLKPNLIVCNPPYIRHHHLSRGQKTELQAKAKAITGIRLNGLSGYYCYYMLISNAWLTKGGLGCWLIPSEFLDVNYGKQVKEFLLSKVKLLRVHRFDPETSKFDDALVSSVVFWYRNEFPDKDDKIKFTFGDSLTKPEYQTSYLNKDLYSAKKWSKNTFLGLRHRSRVNKKQTNVKISDLFQIKRGIATGANNFFILTSNQIKDQNLPFELFIPILPSPRFVDSNEVLSDDVGIPKNIKKLFLLNCHLQEHLVQKKYPTLWSYLENGKKDGIHERYLCRHRSPWYAQEIRPPSPILCTYMGRSQNPFRFILNHTSATAPNVYLMLYPKGLLQNTLEQEPKIIRVIWDILREIDTSILKEEGRVYGGGLYKMEPKELGNTLLENVDDVLPGIKSNVATQLSFI